MEEEKKSKNFIEQIIDNDIQNGLDVSKLRFRFPPEPNGYLHIGHVKAMYVNFTLGQTYNAPVNLRFDDTNPAKESQEFVDAIKKDILWLGYSWDKEQFASDYFDQLFDWAVELIKQGKAYADEQNSELIAEQRKTPFEDGVESPYRDRPVQESLDLFNQMKNGDLAEGACVIRAKIDMKNPNMNMRDPIMYRILNQKHHRTGDQWKIYPTYDWTHGQSDYIEQISHSLCSLEFENHRPLYEWYLHQIYTQGQIKNKQREFARLNLNYTVTSKRKLQQLVEKGVVSGWDDPRMPTISGLRRRGYTPESLKNFMEKVGVAKRENQIDVALLEFSIREDLNKKANRLMAVLNPVKLILTNYPEDKVEELETENNPEDENSGTRKMPFSRELYIERDDFMEDAPKKFFRLSLGKEVRLKGAYIIKANDVIKDDDGIITEIHATYDSDSKSGSGTEASKRKVKGTLHWVSAHTNLPIQVNVYDRLFNTEAPDSSKEKDFMEFINPNSLQKISGYGEINLKDTTSEKAVQFQRLGYFIKDIDSTQENPIFNKTVGLRDTWGKIKK